MARNFGEALGKQRKDVAEPDAIRLTFNLAAEKLEQSAETGIAVHAVSINMRQALHQIPEVRPLTTNERLLIKWMLEHGTSTARDYLSQVGRTAVVARCGCGCPSVDLAVDGTAPAQGAGMHVLADFQWDGPANERMGAFVFARGGVLAGFEVWSIDGAATPTWLPTPEQLRPFDASGPT